MGGEARRGKGERDGEGMDRSNVWGSTVPGEHVKVKQNSIGKLLGSSKIITFEKC